MKTLTIPAGTFFGPLEARIPISFAEALVGTVLNNSSVFGSRHGARRAIVIESVVRANPGTAVALEDADFAMLTQGLDEIDAKKGWHPGAARAMEAAGWFREIESAGK